jgi:hypothetical protein
MPKRSAPLDEKRVKWCENCKPKEMPEKSTIEKAKQALRKGKSPSTAAGEFIREEMDELKKGNRGVRSQKQAIAIGLARARRAGVPLRPQKESRAEARARRSVEHAYEVGQKKKAAAPAAKRTAKRKRKPTGSKSSPSRRVKAPTRRKRTAARPGR